MIEKPKCFSRKCKWFLGVISEVDDNPERPICEAFPGGIPKQIAYGENKHLKPLPNQSNDIVYQRKED